MSRLYSLLSEIEQHGGVDNFRRLTGSKQCEVPRALYTDSDLYKWIDAVGIAMRVRRAEMKAVISPVRSLPCRARTAI